MHVGVGHNQGQVYCKKSERANGLFWPPLQGGIRRGKLFVVVLMVHGGTYIAVFDLPEWCRIEVGKLGRFWFRPGVYLYVGSAQRNLSARLERHARREKPLRWHIDYLSTKANMFGAMIVPGPRERECELAMELGQMYKLAVPRFGASDCRCRGHLFYTREL